MRHNKSIEPSYNRRNEHRRNEVVPWTDDVFSEMRMPLMQFGGTLIFLF